LTSLANLLAERFPNVSFVYRPHPFERIDSYANLLVPLPNLRLIRQGTVDTWILQSAAVIQRSCSTAIEAALAGSIALSPSWLPTARELPAANDVSYSCATSDEMVDVLKSVLMGSFLTPPEVGKALATVIADWFTAIDGAAAERVSARILTDVPSVRDSSIDGRCDRALYGLDATPRQRLVGRIRKTLRIAPNVSFRTLARSTRSWEKSEKFFGVEKVSRITSAIGNASSKSSQERLRVVDAQSTLDRQSPYRIRAVAILRPRN
jgi:hypothetical protein